LSREFIFELYVEKKRLLEKLDISGAIGALLHLSFVFDLTYVKVVHLFNCYELYVDQTVSGS
jgi:hypothetical protein